ncbi:uncharacterized protein LOC119397635 [Rhipicephalus sanguineus]|uniref:uncharacterized protein LOC119397635 n=1 Tax=Rhipicephalus sanguineus TaxID=34632 RepID=UPI0020C5A84F|nr:uncharacterized protein LOC119397635 [Rhipicephalus sanguineus]
MASIKNEQSRANAITVLQRQFAANDNHSEYSVCSTCKGSLVAGKVPTRSTTNGYRYPLKPEHLAELNPVEERLIAPRLPFMSLRRLTHGNGHTPFVKSLDVVKKKGLNVMSLTTDRHVQVTKYLKTQEPTIPHYYDAWHITNGIKKKLAAHTKRAGCSVLELWIQPATNHLQWCAAMSDGDAELLTDMWKSMEWHVANVHTGHPGLYTHCAHGDLGEMQWLVPGTPAHQKFAAVVMAPRFLKGIRQLAPSTHTFSLEAFHIVLIGFAPKSVCFSPDGMRTRTQLAILHFNENSNKGQAITNEGLSRWKVKNPKARKGTAVACPVKATPTYEYVDLLLTETVRCCEQWSSFKAAFSASHSTAPPPMSHSFPRPPKHEFVAARRSRFAAGTGSTTL